MTHKKFVLLKASLPFVLLAAIVVGLYFWLFLPKDYADLVPAESRAVVALSPSALMADEVRLGNLLSEQLGFRPEGMDEAQDVYLFITPNEYIAACAPLHDSRRLSEQIQRLSQHGQATLLPRSDQLSWAWVKKGWLVAWSSDAVLTIGPGVVQEQDVLRQTASQIFRAGRNKSFRHSEHQAQMDGIQGDVKVFSRLSALPSPFSLLFRLDIPAACNSSKVLLVAGAEVAAGGKPAGGLTLEGKLVSEDEETQKLLEARAGKAAALAQPQRPYAPEGSVLYMAAHSQGDELLTLLRSDQNVRTMLLSLDKGIDAEKLRQQGGGDFMLTLTEMPAKGEAQFRLCVQQGDSVSYDESTFPAPPQYAASPLTAQAAGKRAFFSLDMKRLLRQPALDKEVAATLKGIFGGTERITYEAEEGQSFRLTIE
ncbi:MAG: DUF4836 family protein [Alloprevotella sp.]|nr:DUF4836 family protein [Alloprevotella sp.]MBR1652784.1 DUF4836 family protein [Alloprevotella sp.]